MKYTKEHEWLRVEGDLVVVGITEHAATALGDVVFVELPEVETVVAEGDEVQAGQVLCVVEAMKMEQPLTAHKAGIVTGLNAEVGTTVPTGTELMEIK